MCPHSLAHALNGLGRPRLLVLGDLMLDRYTWGDAQRISQEAPVIVLRADQQRVASWRRCQRGQHAAGARGRSDLRRRDRQRCSGQRAARNCYTTRERTSRGSSPTPAVPPASRNVSSAGPIRGTPSQILRVDHESCEQLDAELGVATDRAASKNNFPGTTRCSSPTTAKASAPRGCCGPRSTPRTSARFR